MLVLLTLVMIFNYIDRVALGLMLPEIKADLGLSDTQLGLMTGIAFAAFYAAMGIPIAHWADRGDRVRIITLTTVLWSAAVAACGMAASFTHLLLMRIGVAVGEAGCHPPAFSLISDYYSREERPRAVARYMLGWPLALLFGFFIGGWLIQFFGWRATFLMLAAPGLVLAVLAALVLDEPRRKLPVAVASKAGTAIVLADLWRNRSYRHLLLAHATSYFFGNGLLQWQPTFLTRSYHIESGELGMWLAGIYGVGGLLGTYVGGELAARYAAGDERKQLAALSVLYVAISVLGAGVYLVGSFLAAITLLIVSSLGAAIVVGPMFSATQSLVAPHARAMSIAVVLFFANLIGLGLGPLAVGMISDALNASFGQEALRYALLALCPGYLWCAWHLKRASRFINLKGTT